MSVTSHVCPLLISPHPFNMHSILNTGQGPAVVCSLYVMKCLISCQSPFNTTSKIGSYEVSRIKSCLRIKIGQMLIFRSVSKEWKNHHSRLLATVCLPWLFTSSCAKWNGRACCTPPSPETMVYWYITARLTSTVVYFGDLLYAPRRKHYIYFTLFGDMLRAVS